MGNDIVIIQISWGTEGAGARETVLARPLGEDLYELRSPPKLFPELTCGDVVRASAVDSAGGAPSVREVVSRGGHSTVRLIFTRGTFEHEVSEVLSALKDQGFTAEQGGQRMYVIDAATIEEYRRVQKYLAPWVGNGRVRLAAANSIEELLVELEGS